MTQMMVVGLVFWWIGLGDATVLLFLCVWLVVRR